MNSIYQTTEILDTSNSMQDNRQHKWWREWKEKERSKLTAPEEQLLGTFCYEWAAFHDLSAPTKSIDCRSPGPQQKEFLSSNEKSDKLPDDQDMINQAMTR